MRARIRAAANSCVYVDTRTVPDRRSAASKTASGAISTAGSIDRPDFSPNGSWIYQDDLTWLHRSHTFKFGYEYRRYFYNDRALSDAGNFTFSARQTDLPGQLTATGNAFASFVLGAATAVPNGR